MKITIDQRQHNMWTGIQIWAEKGQGWMRWDSETMVEGSGH